MEGKAIDTLTSFVAFYFFNRQTEQQRKHDQTHLYTSTNKGLINTDLFFQYLVSTNRWTLG